MPTKESLTSASIPRSLNNLQVSFAAGIYAFPYSAISIYAYRLKYSTRPWIHPMIQEAQQARSASTATMQRQYLTPESFDELTRLTISLCTRIMSDGVQDQPDHLEDCNNQRPKGDGSKRQSRSSAKCRERRMLGLSIKFASQFSLRKTEEGRLAISPILLGPK
jgi:hypothetical protein